MCFIPRLLPSSTCFHAVTLLCISKRDLGPAWIWIWERSRHSSWSYRRLMRSSNNQIYRLGHYSSEWVGLTSSREHYRTKLHDAMASIMLVDVWSKDMTILPNNNELGLSLGVCPLETACYLVQTRQIAGRRPEARGKDYAHQGRPWRLNWNLRENIKSERSSNGLVFRWESYIIRYIVQGCDITQKATETWSEAYNEYPKTW